MLGVRVMTGADFPGTLYFLPSLLGAVLWPLLFNVIRVPLRPRTDPDAV
jgi:cell shape-determining protein MreD